VLDAISEEKEATAAIGIDVLRKKLRVTVISAALTAFGGGIAGKGRRTTALRIRNGIGAAGGGLAYSLMPTAQISDLSCPATAGHRVITSVRNSVGAGGYWIIRFRG
jgi:hypothetical protein